MENYIHDFADFLRSHLSSISVGIISTILVIYGGALNQHARKLTKKFPFIGRFAFFVVLCSAGYGLLSSQLVRYLRHFLMDLQDLHLILAITLSFIILGFLAKSSKNA